MRQEYTAKLRPRKEGITNLRARKEATTAV